MLNFRLLAPFVRWPHLFVLGFACVACPALGQNPAASILADFEDDSVAASITETSRVLRADCTVQRTGLPARGQNSLALTIGATQNEVSAVCDLIFRTPERFSSIQEVGGFVWIKESPVHVAYRLRDADGRIFETPEHQVSEKNRWVTAAAAFDEKKLKRISGEGELAWPVQLAGLRLTTTARGRQTIHVDDLQVLHSVPATKVLGGSFRFDEPTHIYSPRSQVKAQAVLENQSREKALVVNVDLAWIDQRGEVIRKQSATVNLPAASKGFRSVQTMDFSERIDVPGIYRIVARARVGGWAAPAEFESTIAVTPTNRFLSRGRSKLFGIHTNLLRETATDQLLELAIARDIGAEIVMLDVPWSLIEPKDDTFDTSALDPLLDFLAKSSISAGLAITGVPEWIPQDASDREAQFETTVSRLAQAYAGKLRLIQFPGELFPDQTPDQALERARRMQGAQNRVSVIPPPLSPAELAALPAEERKSAALALATSGTTAEAIAETAEILGTTEPSGKAAPNANLWWQHRAAPIVGAGTPADAVALLRHYIIAANRVAGVLWFDLRDDDTVSGPADQLRGLVRRDFSPKLELLGFTSAAGIIAGLTYDGPVFQTPPELESALFIGSDRQVAVFVPRPNCILPAVIGLRAGVSGEWQVQRFDRGAEPLLAKEPVPLIVPGGEPKYATLKLQSVQPNPQIACEPPWIRAPGTVFTGEQFMLEFHPPELIRKGYWQASAPQGAPYSVTPATGTLVGAAGTPISVPVQLQAKAGQEFEESVLTLKISANERTLELPLQVRPGISLKAGAAPTSAEHLLGVLTPPARQRATTNGKFFASYTPEKVFVAVEVNAEGPERWDGGRLHFGIAAEGLDARHEVEVLETEEGQFKTVVIEGKPDWNVKPTAEAGNRQYRLEIPARSLGLDQFGPQARLLLTCRYVASESPGFASEISWGQGPGLGQSGVNYRWVRLQ